jgi:16S rRNA (adenine1518-N6/adenine1519-N6)-dimethyltransferase
MQNEDLKNLLKRYHLSPNYTYGQNFLIDDSVLDSMVECAEVSEQDVILEIGPGIGNLTRRLCERGSKVLAIEKDPKFLPLLTDLQQEFPHQLHVVIADALEFDNINEFQKRFEYNELHPNYPNGDGSEHSDSISKFGSSYKVVANIPYYITGKILEKFLTTAHKPRSITVLVQKEVAERVVAKAGELNVLAISVQIFGEPKIFQVVKRESFFPAPKVDSAILHIDLFKAPKYQIANQTQFFKILKACFVGKRKQLHNTLTGNLALEKKRVLQILEALNINPQIRPQALTIEQWVSLSEKLF